MAQALRSAIAQDAERGWSIGVRLEECPYKGAEKAEWEEVWKALESGFQGMLKPGQTSPKQPANEAAKDAVCAEVRDIMAEYRRQAEAGFVDTPGGLENMGDVWKLLGRWDELLGRSE
jgi:hypothetical protein